MLPFIMERSDFMNFGTKIRTVLAVATSLNTALMATDLSGFANVYVDLAYKIVSIILNFVIVALVTYYNNDYTETACEYTGLMRREKNGYDEDFIGEEFDEVDDDGEEEEDE